MTKYLLVGLLAGLALLVACSSDDSPGGATPDSALGADSAAGADASTTAVACGSETCAAGTNCRDGRCVCETGSCCSFATTITRTAVEGPIPPASAYDLTLDVTVEATGCAPDAVRANATIASEPAEWRADGDKLNFSRKLTCGFPNDMTLTVLNAEGQVLDSEVVALASPAHPECLGVYPDPALEYFQLSISFAGAGAGRVEDTLSPIVPTCDSASGCVFKLPVNTFLTLQAVPDANSTFESWGGVFCGQETTDTCSLNQQSTVDLSVTATFAAK